MCPYAYFCDGHEPYLYLFADANLRVRIRNDGGKITKVNDAYDLLESLDFAMLNEIAKGGIDFKPDKVDSVFAIKSNGGEIKFHIDPAMLRQLQNAPGFMPVIINIQPMTDLRLFLGLNQEAPAQPGHA